MATIFHEPELRPRERYSQLEAAVQRFPEDFPTIDSARIFMSEVVVPPSLRWAYKGNGKTGTSSTKRFLFELEFGVSLTTQIDPPSDINPDAAAHRLTSANVYREISALSSGLAVLETTLRLTTVRNPTSRATSAFLYLCASSDQRHVWFSDERLRMNALVGFDWQRDVRTSRGMDKFLNYIQIMIENHGVDTINRHWRPQVASIKPRVLRPHLIGKTEEMETFYRDIAERLDRPLPDNWVTPRANRNVSDFDPETLLSAEALSRIEVIYAKDFEEFGY
ncbi:sulfotransferase family 2 domain-containing protein [Ruegeria hyattellae]|uniref:sulfotransferase family 2 domain-containing protein n=1 Tax=Ruegeria hyattellae TaxID=3233337 RepID=UPI00355C2C38